MAKRKAFPPTRPEATWQQTNTRLVVLANHSTRTAKVKFEGKIFACKKKRSSFARVASFPKWNFHSKKEKTDPFVNFVREGVHR